MAESPDYIFNARLRHHRPVERAVAKRIQEIIERDYDNERGSDRALLISLMCRLYPDLERMVKTSSVLEDGTASPISAHSVYENRFIHNNLYKVYWIVPITAKLAGTAYHIRSIQPVTNKHGIRTGFIAVGYTKVSDDIRGREKKRTFEFDLDTELTLVRL